MKRPKTTNRAITMQTATLINQGNVYGSPMDSGYRTTDLHEAEAHAFIYSPRVVAGVTSRLEQSGRFTTKPALEGALKRNLELLHWFETLRRKGTPMDYFGLDEAGK